MNSVGSLYSDFLVPFKSTFEFCKLVGRWVMVLMFVRKKKSVVHQPLKAILDGYCIWKVVMGRVWGITEVKVSVSCGTLRFCCGLKIFIVEFEKVWFRLGSKSRYRIVLLWR